MADTHNLFEVDPDEPDHIIPPSQAHPQPQPPGHEEAGPAGGPAATAAAASPSPSVVNINLFGSVNRNTMDLLREVMQSPPTSPSFPPLAPGPPRYGARFNPWEVPLAQQQFRPLTRRGRGRPPGHTTVRTRMLAAAAAVAPAQAPIQAPVQQASFFNSPMATPVVNECLTCRRESDGIVSCGHFLCSSCVENANGVCQDPLCTNVFDRNLNYTLFRRS